MKDAAREVRGRGAASNPGNRFEPTSYDRSEWNDPEDASPSTVLLRDASRSIIAFNDSPDVGFAASVNPYRGCEHGCIYCYARPNHEYVGFSAGLDFETKILVKEDAPDLLRAELSSSRWQPQPIAISGVTDAYQPIEKRLQLTRRCLEVLAGFRNPIVVITKNELVTRDIDLLMRLANDGAAQVFISVTSLDSDLARELEPRASQPARRLKAIETLAQAGVPAGVMVAPVIPGLTDHEMPHILEAAARAGARMAGYTPVRLPYGLGPLFDEWLSVHRPLQKEKILGRIRDIRRGELNDPRFGSRMRGSGPYAEHLRQLFEVTCRKLELNADDRQLNVDAFRRPEPLQRSLW